MFGFTTRRLRLAPLGLAVLALGTLAACGGQSQPAGSIKVTMTEFKFDPSSIDAKAGDVTFFLVNSGSTGHDMVVEDSSGKTVAKSDMVGSGDSSVFAVKNLAAGSYTVVCDVQGHKEAGMKGTLNVT